MGGTKRQSARQAVELWEVQLVRQTAQKIRTRERDDLEAELLRKLMQLKSRKLAGVDNWKAYLRTSLRNAALNYIREQPSDLPLLDQTDESSEWSGIPSDMLVAEENLDLVVALGNVWTELDPELRQLWQLLLQEQGNQLAVARRLGKHRNTVRLWIKRIVRLLERHGIA